MTVYLCPASKVLYDQSQCSRGVADINQRHVTAVCQTSRSANSAYDLIVSLCTGCLPNLQIVQQSLSQLFYQGFYISL